VSLPLLPDCTVVVATLDRLDSLRVVLQCLARQTYAPLEIIIAASGDISAVEKMVQDFHPDLPIRVLGCSQKSSASQRNTAAALARGGILAFLDDDIEFEPDLFSRILAYFIRHPKAGAIAARNDREKRRRPGRMTRTYYRFQAGYDHPDFGGRLFGPGINCYPVFPADSPELLSSEWLPSTCLFVKNEIFRLTLFPAFHGYSFAEDVHLTARIAKLAPLYFATDCFIIHHSLPSEFKVDLASLTSGKLHNMGVIAREVQGLDELTCWWRWQIHRMFMTIVTLCARPPQWYTILRGVWSARL